MIAQKPKLGISACLLGQKVRFDGGHKLDPFIRDTLGQFVEFVAVCPEVECGLGVPREAMRLVKGEDSPRLQTIRTKLDHTERMLSWAQERLISLEKEDLCGFIFKSRSPSCGMERVKLYSQDGVPSKTGVGIFAKKFMEHFPLIPSEEEGRLFDPALRENFIERIFALKRWRDAKSKGLTSKELVEFHTQHKLLIFSHSEKHLREMGKLVARGNELSAKEVFDRYENLLMHALRLKATKKKHYNVMQHIMGYFKKLLSSDEKQELLEVMGNYLKGYLPLIVPITLLNHYVRKFKEPYLQQQVYLNPHPVSLQLRNHV